MNYSDILKKNKELENSIGGERYTITILSNIVVSQLKEILEYSLRTHNINVLVNIGDYDNILQDSMKCKQQHLVILYWELANLIDGLQYKADLMRDEELNDLITKTKFKIDYVFENLKDLPLVIVNRFSTIVFNYHYLKENRFDRICKELNNHLERKVLSNMLLIDIEKVISKVSVERSVDLRYYYSSKALYSIDFYKEYANFIRPIVLSVRGKAKKAMIFDCDNTLWNGILGEDGYDAVEMSIRTARGTVFEEVQSLARYLNREGIVIGICSKNNERDVEYIIDNHSDMVLKSEHITIKKINWNDKVSNLQEIAKELNIGLDSIVFVDDSDFEVDYIRKSLPDVTVLHIPQRLHQYPKVIRENLRLFYNISRSWEDIRKAEIYKTQMEREEEKSKFSSLEEYLRSLELIVTVHRNDKLIIPRMAQLTQKTNQFNLTTKRYTETELKKFLESETHEVFAFGLSDRFGDYGITGLAIIEMSGEAAVIDSFLMSCRIIGRNIEYAFFDFLMSFLIEGNVKTVRASYVRTLKNEQVESLFEKMGFAIIQNSGNEKNYEIIAKDYKPTNIDYVKLEQNG